MSSLYPQNWISYINIAMIFLRLLGLFILVPAFSHRAIPANVKLLLALGISLAFYPMLRPLLEPIPASLGGILLYALRETAVGFLMGFVASLTFEAISLAAQFVGYQMGFGTAGLIDPQSQSSVSALVPVHFWLAMMVFLFTNMHHGILRLFFLSFETTRNLQNDWLANQNLLKLFVTLSGNLFVIAVQMAAPLTILVLACNAAIGIVSRMLPQMNVILFSFPLTMTLGFCTLYLLAPDLLNHIENLMGQMSNDIVLLLKTV